jgi:serine protease Do
MRHASVSVLLALALAAGLNPVCLGARQQGTERAAALHSRASALPDFATLVTQVAPAVVHVSATHKLAIRNLPPPGIVPAPDALEEDSDDDAPPPSPGTEREIPALASGSGFVISNDGYILTNAHMVAGAQQVVVRLRDKRELKAEIVGIDAPTDVALIKVQAERLSKVTIGNPAKLKVGEWVAAIGSPFGLENSVTKGIVSATGRALPDEAYVPFIQTDAAVNPGNSGGPLFNMKGEVVGITSQIYSRTGGFMGIAFAIPIDVAMDVSKQLSARGKVTRGSLGVAVQEVTPALAKAFRFKDGSGALVASVQSGGPADKVGMEPGDIIVSYGGKRIERATDLPRLVASTKPGSSIAVAFWHQGERKDSTVVVEELISLPPA